MLLLLTNTLKAEKPGSKTLFPSNPLFFLLPYQHPQHPGSGRWACRGKNHYLRVHRSKQGWGPGRLHTANAERLWPRRQVGVRNPVGHLMGHGWWALAIEPGALLHLWRDRENRWMLHKKPFPIENQGMHIYIGSSFLFLSLIYCMIMESRLPADCAINAF